MTAALVVGGGPAGAEVARRIALAGEDVVLLERDASTVDKVCGEFLSREAVLYLKAAGIDLASFGAVPIDTVRLATREIVAEVALPFEASSLSRRILDEASLALAAAQGVRIERGCPVRAFMRTPGGHRAVLADGRTFDARALFIATGKHDLRGHKRAPGLQNDLVGFKLHYVLTGENTRAIERCVELILFDGGYAGLQPIERGRANLCLLVRKDQLARCGGRFDSLIESISIASPHLGRRLRGASRCWEKPLAIASIPYGYVRAPADEVFWVGDQSAVIPSFSGDGISIALHSARLAADTYLAGGTPAAFQRALARDVKGQVLFATALSQAMVNDRPQRALALIAHHFPSLVRSIASHTRVADVALRRAGLAPTALRATR